MLKALKIIAFLTALFMFLFTGKVWATPDGYEVETVGGTLNPVNFMSVFLVPVLAVIGIFGVLLLIGFVHIEADAEEKNNNHVESDN